MGALRCRGGQIHAQLQRCQDAGLRERLGREFADLQGRRRELQGRVRVLQRSGLKDSLALAFLAEISRRPLIPAGAIRS
ncbi:hypothetical protein [Cyanobium sp. Morenito 9A2]|uniref:hypothetical protein n=1 Tax=Cyanobium sp. Morenito 9A2 TaxID=2823718 RepID=UPI0020CC2C9E|nr:hypothetical protein [Cyanobium sp. Morenito 9A2]MCP9848430.1 hypothetical protein [Cyanobium sp. Morenito 9A2]